MKALPSIKKQCLECGAPFEVQPYREKTAKYCSRLCMNRGVCKRTHKQRSDAQRGTGLGKSYIKYYGRHLHRVIAEQKIGRPLQKGEVVHHINGNKRDNRPENLEVLPSQSHHIRIHVPRRGK